jgi:hypothetical protein
VNERGTLGIQRDGAAARPLFHLGSRVFHPSGAVAVRIRFEPGAPARSLTVEDGPVLVTATRVGQEAARFAPGKAALASLVR